MSETAVVALCGLNARYAHTCLALRCLRSHVRRHWPDAPAMALLEATINDSERAILRRLYESQARIYAFSCYIWNITLIRRLCRDLKKLRPDALILWGGPEASHASASWLDCEPSVDLIIRGEGETAFLSLLQTLCSSDWRASASLAGVPSLSWRDPDTGLVRDNDNAPLLDAADWTFPYEASELPALKDRIVYYESSRGCPFRCSYCLSSLDRTVRHRPAGLVLAELDQLMAAGLRQVKLVDRTFNCQPDRARRIWQHLIQHATAGGTANFHFETAGDLLDDTATDLLNQAPAGLIQLEIGVQTLDPAVLRTVGRSMDPERLARQVSRLLAGGRVHLHLDLIAGLPGEDLASFSEALDWVWRLRPQQLQLGFLKVLPGSPMAGMARQRSFCWQDEPPYEILSSDRMSFDDLSRLKRVAWVIDSFTNCGFCAESLYWLTGRSDRPWKVLDGLAAHMAGPDQGERPLSPAERSRLLLEYSCLTDPELAGGSWLSAAWRDLLRLDYQLSGQKDQPAWLGFSGMEISAAQADGLRQARAYFRTRFPLAGRLRTDLIHFDLAAWLDDRALRPGLSAACLDLSAGRPVLLDNCRVDDLY